MALSPEEPKALPTDPSRSPSQRTTQIQAPQQQQIVPANVSPYMGQKHGRQGQIRQKVSQQNQTMQVGQLGQMDAIDSTPYQDNMSQYQPGAEDYTDQYYGEHRAQYEGGEGEYQQDYNQSYQDYDYGQRQRNQNEQQDTTFQGQYDQGQYQDYGQDYGSSQPYSSELSRYGDYTQQYVQDPANYSQGYPEDDLAQGMMGYNEHLNPHDMQVDHNQYYGQSHQYSHTGYY